MEHQWTMSGMLRQYIDAEALVPLTCAVSIPSSNERKNDKSEISNILEAIALKSRFRLVQSLGPCADACTCEGIIQSKAVT